MWEEAAGRIRKREVSEDGSDSSEEERMTAFGACSGRFPLCRVCQVKGAHRHRRSTSLPYRKPETYMMQQSVARRNMGFIYGGSRVLPEHYVWTRDTIDTPYPARRS